MRFKIPEKEFLKKVFGFLGAILIAGLLIKALFLAILVVLALFLKALGIRVAAGWLMLFTGSLVTLFIVKRKEIIDFYIKLWCDLREVVDGWISKRGVPCS